MASSTDPQRDVRIPRETVNDDVVTVQSWSVAHGSKVTSGQSVADIETSKSVIEVEAESDGYLHHLFAAGSEVPIGAVIGRVEAQPPSDETGVSSTAAGDAADVASDTKISRKAQVLIEKHGLDAAIFHGRGLVRERDVRDWMNNNESGATEGDGTSAAKPTTQATQPLAAPIPVQDDHVPNKPQYSGKGLLGDARASASDRGTSLFVLVWNYFWRNWFLGNLVKIAPRGVIKVLHRWRGVKMGPDCFIDPTAILETAYPENITMGKDVRVTVGCIIMTHIKAPHHLRETGIMPAVVKPVVLEDHCFIGVNSVIMPGVTVGRCSVVTSGSVVMTNVPPYTMVTGNPAKVVKKFPCPDGESSSG